MSSEAYKRYQLAKLACTEDFLERIFVQGRSFKHWTSRSVDDTLLDEVYELARWSPSAVNQSSLRITYIKSSSAKEQLLPCVSESNVREVKEAPVVAILSTDLEFWKHLEMLGTPKMAARYVDNAERAKTDGTFNSNILAGFFMVAARVKGLDIHPMGGWSRTAVDATFHTPDPSRASWRSFLICTMGYADRSEDKVPPRLPRLPFDQASLVYDCRSDTVRNDASKDESKDIVFDEDVVERVKSNVQRACEDVLFRQARAYPAYLPGEKSLEYLDVKKLETIYDFAKLYPSAFNSTPLRIAFVFAPDTASSAEPGTTDEAKVDLNPAHRAYSILMGSLAGGNVEGTRTAPLIAVLAADSDFVNKFDTTNPDWDSKAYFNESRAANIPGVATTNAIYGIGWFISVVRALGFDCGPMGGFDKVKAAEMFLPKDVDIGEGEWRDSRTRGWVPLMLVKIGAGDPSKLRPRYDRLPHEIARAVL